MRGVMMRSMVGSLARLRKSTVRSMLPFSSKSWRSVVRERGGARQDSSGELPGPGESVREEMVAPAAQALALAPTPPRPSLREPPASPQASPHLLEEVRGLHVDAHGRKHNGKLAHCALRALVPHQACAFQGRPAGGAGGLDRLLCLILSPILSQTAPCLLLKKPLLRMLTLQTTASAGQRRPCDQPTAPAHCTRPHLLAGRSARQCRCAAGRRPRRAGSSGRGQWSSSRQWWRCPAAGVGASSLGRGRSEALRQHSGETCSTLLHAG